MELKLGEFYNTKRPSFLQLALPGEDTSFLQPAEKGSESFSLPDKGGRTPSPQPSSFLSSAFFGEGDASCRPWSDHSSVSGNELLPPEHHHEMVEGQAASGRRGGWARGRAAQRGRDLPRPDRCGGAPRRRAEIQLPGGAARPAAAPHCRLGALAFRQPGHWSHQCDCCLCRRLPYFWNFVPNLKEEAGFKRCHGRLRLS